MAPQLAPQVGDTRTTADYWFGRTEKPNRLERTALLCFVGVLVVTDIAGMVTSTGTPAWQGALSVAATVTLALYAWSPLIASGALAGVVALSFLAGNAVDVLVAGAIAALLVVRLGSTPLLISYTGALLVSSALISAGYGTGGEPATITVLLLFATVSGFIGLALRLAYTRGHRLEAELARQAQRKREAVQAERRWIAGELHDSIAHHLTVVALHAQMLDDDAARPESTEVILTAARKALSDLRFVISLADDLPATPDRPASDLSAALAEAQAELQATGRQVTVCRGEPTDAQIPRNAQIVLARILRETVTNILKYAGPGEVRIFVGDFQDGVTLRISNPLPDQPRNDLLSTGTGLNRMAERVLGVRGQFRAGPAGDTWEVEAKLPFSAGPESAEE